MPIPIDSMVFKPDIGISTRIWDIFYHQYLDIFSFVFTFKRYKIMFTYKYF